MSAPALYPWWLHSVGRVGGWCISTTWFTSDSKDRSQHNWGQSSKAPPLCFCSCSYYFYFILPLKSIAANRTVRCKVVKFAHWHEFDLHWTNDGAIANSWKCKHWTSISHAPFDWVMKPCLHIPFITRNKSGYQIFCHFEFCEKGQSSTNLNAEAEGHGTKPWCKSYFSWPKGAL